MAVADALRQERVRGQGVSKCCLCTSICVVSPEMLIETHILKLQARPPELGTLGTGHSGFLGDSDVLLTRRTMHGSRYILGVDWFILDSVYLSC